MKRLKKRGLFLKVREKYAFIHSSILLRVLELMWHFIGYCLLLCPHFILSTINLKTKTLTWVVNTRYNTQMMCYRIVHLKLI